MRKLTFDAIFIEVTRRCNLKCQHCFRGDAQEVDIEPATIDALMEQAARIYSLSFTGGEPTLNVSAMQHTLDTLQSHGIPLHSVEVATNGAVLSREIAETIKGFAKYIAAWNDDPSAVSVGVSKDRYHKGADPDAAFDFYQRELAGIAVVKFMRRGEVPVMIGRGRALDGARSPYIIGSLPHKIETLEAGRYCDCKEKHQWPLPQGDEKIVCCRLSLSAHGDLMLYSNHEGEYAAEDAHRDLVICNLSPGTPLGARDIDHGIVEYNKRFPSCRAVEGQESAMQEAVYKKNPRRAIHDLRCAYQLMQLDPSAKATLLSQWPDLEEQFELFLGLLDIAECLPDERLAELMKRNGLQPSLWA